MAVFTGSGVALVTPFTDSGVDFDALSRLVDFQLKNGIDAIIACGTTGESSTMSEAECNAVIGHIVQQVAGRVPVIAGTGCNDTAHAIQHSIDAQALGADALLVVTPYYNKCTQKGLVAHYTAIADAVRLPVIIYNVPARTGLDMTPATLDSLANHPNIVGMKEASGDIRQMSEMTRLCGDRCAIYSGDDFNVVPLLSMGGAGVISVAANIVPQDVHTMVAKFFAGDLAGARALQWQLLPLCEGLFAEVNPIPIKTAMNLMGMGVGKLRLPLCDMEEKTLALLQARLTAYGLITK